MDIVIGARHYTVPEPKGAAACTMYDEAISALATSGALKVLLEADGAADLAVAIATLAGVPGIRPMLARHLKGATLDGRPLDLVADFGPGHFLDIYTLAVRSWKDAGFLDGIVGSPTASPEKPSPTGTI